MLFAVLLQGCATAKPMVTRLDQRDKSAFASDGIASSYYMADKVVRYSENLFRVLWLEHDSSDLDFSGIWQPDDEFTTLVNAQLNGRSLHASRISDLIDHKSLEKYYYSQLHQDFQPYITGKQKNIPVVQYLNRYPAYPGFEHIRKRLRKERIRYLFEVLSALALGNDIGAGNVKVITGTYMRIIDLENKKVVWADTIWGYNVYQVGGDFIKLEAKNLALLKAGVTSGLKAALSKGLTQAIGTSP